MSLYHSIRRWTIFLVIGVIGTSTLFAQTRIVNSVIRPTQTTVPVMSATCSDVCEYRQFSWAIAKQEGFFVKGSLPNRNHNPGDIKFVTGYRFDGQIGIDKHGHVIFRNDNKGWAALQNQVRLMCSSQGRYSADMTIQQIGRHYANDWKRWSANVARNMKCDPRTTLAQLFGIPPVVSIQPDPHALEGII